MPFVPVDIRFQDSATPRYSRQIELTERQLAAFRHEAGDMSPAFERIADDLRTNIEAAFGSQGANGMSGPWTQLSPGYGAWKARRAPGVPILVGLRPTSWVGKRTNPPGEQRNPNQEYEASGKMMRQLLVPLADHITWQISPTRLRYTPVSDIAGYHETGTDDMPPRPPVDPTVSFLHSVDRTFVRWLAAAMRRAGL